MSPLLEFALGPLDFGRLWVPVPVGFGTVADAFFELLNKLLDTKSCSEIIQAPAPSSGRLSKLTFLN